MLPPEQNINSSSDLLEASFFSLLRQKSIQLKRKKKKKKKRKKKKKEEEGGGGEEEEGEEEIVYLAELTNQLIQSSQPSSTIQSRDISLQVHKRRRVKTSSPKVTILKDEIMLLSNN